MQARIVMIGISFFCMSLIANDFREIEELIQDKEYTDALDEMASTKLSRISTKRLLVRLAKQWSRLSLDEKKMFNSLIVDLLPADQVFIQNIKERYLELADEEEAITPPVRKVRPTPVPATKTTSSPAVKKVVARPVQVTKASIKKAPAPRPLQKPTAKKVAAKKKRIIAPRRMVPKKQVPVSRPIPEQKIQVIETRIPMETSVREEL
jgi:hypothetical protein